MNKRRYVILTPFAQADVVAGVVRLRGYDVAVIPTSTGTIVVRDLPVPTYDDWDVAELLGELAEAKQSGSGADSEDPSDNADEVAAQLSRLSKYGVVLAMTELGEDVGLEAGVSGVIKAYRVINGERADEISAGLLMNYVDPVVEELLLGKDVADVQGVIERDDVTPSFLERFLGRGKRKGSKKPGAPLDGEAPEPADGEEPDATGEAPDSADSAAPEPTDGEEPDATDPGSGSEETK